MIKAVFQKLFGGSGNANFRSVVPIYDLAGWVHRAVFSEVVAITDNTTLTADDSGKTYTIGVDAKTITLPPTEAGVKFTFVMNAARTTVEIVISPNAADGIYGTTNASTNVVLSGTDDVDIKNTKATAEKGDCITLVGDGVNGWFVVGCHGIWANVS